jgi:hypothetical protein
MGKPVNTKARRVYVGVDDGPWPKRPGLPKGWTSDRTDVDGATSSVPYPKPPATTQAAAPVAVSAPPRAAARSSSTVSANPGSSAPRVYVGVDDGPWPVRQALPKGWTSDRTDVDGATSAVPYRKPSAATKATASDSKTGAK